MKKSEILGVSNGVQNGTNEYYIKELSSVHPQRNYYSVYTKESFYVFSKPIQNSKENQTGKHYRLIEKIFVFVATKLIGDGERSFVEQFVDCNGETKKKNEEQSWENMYIEFCRNMDEE